MVIKSLVAGGAIVLAGTCFLSAQQNSEQPGNSQGRIGESSTNAGSSTPAATPGQPASNVNNNAANDITTVAGGAGMRHDAGHYMTDCLINGNQGEITLAKIALQRATDPEVKNFAQRMIQDHTAFISKLQGTQGNAAGQQQPGGQSAIGQQNGNRNTVGNRDVDVNAPGAQVRVGVGESNNSAAGLGTEQNGRERNGREQNGRERNGRGMQASGARQFLQIEKEVAAQCLQSKQQELSGKEGAQFDRCYMHGQVAAHMKMADELSVYSRHASDNQQAVFQEGLQTTKQHLQMAKQIADRLDGGNGRTANRNENPIGQ